MGSPGLLEDTPFDLKSRRHRVLDGKAGAVVRCDSRGRIRYLGAELSRYLDFVPEQVLGRLLSEVLGEGPFSLLGEAVELVLGSEEEVIVEFSNTSAGGKTVQQFRVLPEWDDDGRVLGTVAVGRDVSELHRWRLEGENLPDTASGRVVTLGHDLSACKRTEEALKERTAKLEASQAELRMKEFVLDHFGDAAFVVGEQERFLYVNEQACRSLGYTRAELLTMTVYGIDAEFSLETVKPIPVEGPGQHFVAFETVHRRKDGSVFPVELRLSSLDYEGRKLTLAIARDITERNRVEQALARREREFRTLTENSPDLIVRYDAQLQRTYVNRAYLDSLKSGARPTGEALAPLLDFVKKVKETRLVHEMEHTREDASGKPRTFAMKAVPEFDESGHFVGILSVGRDITEIDNFRRDIKNLAFHDPLTGLTNRHLFNDRMTHHLAEAQRTRQPVGLMMLDLDRFKNVNDTFGHPVGDELLRQVASRLVGCVREADTVARLGGDEFAVLLPMVRNSRDLGVIAKKITSAFHSPFPLGNTELVVSVSLGIAFFPDDAEKADDLLRYADTALYHAKSSGRNNYKFYSAELTRGVTQSLALEADLRKSIVRKELETYYQPKIDLQTGTLAGFEALVRWNHSTKGLILPDKFIGIAEETGQIVNLGKWILRDACERITKWNSSSGQDLVIAVNLSSRQFTGPGLLKMIQATLLETGCSPRWLELEITESLLLDHRKEVLGTLQALSEMGCTIAIDDFGTGYSALNYLTGFPIDTVKIDRSFIHEIAESNKATLVKAIINLARDLNMKVVAEGVETREQEQLLQDLRCHLAQGYYYGKPMQRLEIERAFF